MVYLNSKLWKSAYLLEFYDGAELGEAFAFSVPPQSEDFSYPQRVNETKTFGGSVFEDYGNDTIQISLAGTTINQELKFIYRGTKRSPKYLSGEDEIFYLKDIIARYGNFNKLTNKRVYLYSLESGKTNVLTNHKCWRIWIQALDIKRSKDKPFCYDYSLKAIGIPYDKEIRTLSNLSVLKTVKDIIQEINDGVDSIEEVLGSFTDAVLEYTESIRSYLTEISDLYDQIEGLVTNAIDTSDLLITEADAFGNTIAEIITKPKQTQINILNACTNLVNSYASFKQWLGDFDDTTTSEQIIASLDMAEQDYKDAMDQLKNDTEKSVNQLNSAVNEKVAETSTVSAVVPGSDGEQDTILTFSGYKEYTFKDGDTWASIANDIYGSTTPYATLLQLYNADVELDNLTTGTVIYVPSENSATNSENKIYTVSGNKDVYGHDLSVSDGDFSVKNGDLSITKGVSTVQQAIQSRLSTALNSRIRNVVYGIRNETGIVSNEKEACSTYITTSISRTILEDPRIDSIESLTWDGEGENINVKVTYKTILGSTRYFEGAI